MNFSLTPFSANGSKYLHLAELQLELWGNCLCCNLHEATCLCCTWRLGLFSGCQSSLSGVSHCKWGAPNWAKWNFRPCSLMAILGYSFYFFLILLLFCFIRYQIWLFTGKVFLSGPTFPNKTSGIKFPCWIIVNLH